MRLCLFALLIFYSSVLFSQEVPEKYNVIWLKVNENPEGSASVQNELKKLRKKNPNDPWIFWISGISCNPVTGQQEAEEFFRKAIKINPAFPHAYYSLAMTLHVTDPSSTSEVIDLLTKSIQYNPYMGFNYLERAKIYLDLGNYDSARRDTQKARESKEVNPVDTYEIDLEALWKQNKKEEAFDLARKTDFVNSTSGPSLVAALVYSEMGEQAKACQIYRNIAEDFSLFDIKLPETIENGLKKCP